MGLGPLCPARTEHHWPRLWVSQVGLQLIPSLLEKFKNFDYSTRIVTVPINALKLLSLTTPRDPTDNGSLSIELA